MSHRRAFRLGGTLEDPLDPGVQLFDIDPSQYGIPPTVAGALRGGDAEENARMVRGILEGETGARRDVVMLNAAAALWVAGAADNLDEGLAQARDSVLSGAAVDRLERLIAASARAAADVVGEEGGA